MTEYTGWDQYVKANTSLNIKDKIDESESRVFRSVYQSEDVHIKGTAKLMSYKDVFVKKDVLSSCSGDEFMSYVKLGDKKGKNVMCDLDTIAVMMNRIKDLEDRVRSFD